MTENDILGISGQMDISDIQNSFNNIISELDKLGIKTDEISVRMSKALNDISQNASSDSEKTKEAISVLKQGLVDINSSLSSVPESLKKMSSEAQTAENTVSRLSKKLSETKQGSSEWGKINEQLSTQKQYAAKLNDEYSSLFNTFNSAQQYIGTLNAAIDVLNAGQSLSNASTIVSSVAHTGVASSVALESAAHAKNAEEINNETQKVSENIEVTNNASEASRQRVDNANAEYEALQRLAEQIKQGSVSEEQYIRAKEDANTRWEQLQEERNALTKKQEEIQERNNEAYNDMLQGKISSEDYEKQLDINQQIYDSLQQQKSALSQTMQQLQDGISAINGAYSSLGNTQQQIADNNQSNTQKEIEDTNKTKDAIREKEDELKRLKEQLEQMQAHHDAGWGDDFVSKYRKGENPFGAISEYFAESKDIDETKRKITETSEEIEKMKQAAQGATQDVSDMNNELTKEEVYTSIKNNKEELANITEQLNAAKKAGNDKRAEELKERQKEINKEIDEANVKLQKMGTSYKEVAEEAKKTAKETGKIGEKKGGNVLSEIQGVSKDLKSGFSGGFNVGNLSKMVFSKGGAAVMAVGAAAYTVKWVSEQNRMLDESMIALKGYLDSGVLEQLREQFVQLEYDSTHSAEEMAAAGTRWVKYFEGIRGNADAIADVTNASNNLATVLGTTSEKAADYILKIAGAYHQTAAEAKDNSTILINASKLSTARYEELAQAISSSANRAAQAGANLREFTSAVAYSAGSFGSASSAASTYTMMLQRLSSQSKNEYNPSVVGATKALENLSKSQNLNDTLTKLLGKRQASLAKIFVQNASAIDDMKKKLDNVEVAMKVVNASESKMENQEKKLQNAKRALAHELNTNLTPAYTEFLNYISTTIRGLGNLAHAFKGWVAPIVSWFKKLDKNFSSSTIWRALKTSFRNIPGLNAVSAMMDVHDIQSSNDKAETEREKRLTKIFNDNLKKYGQASPGKAFMASVSQITSKTGKYSKKDREFLRKLNAKTVVENASRTNGVDLKIGEENAVSDKNSKKEHDNKVRAQEKLKEDLKSLQQKNIDDELALQEEGTKKKLAQIDNDYNKRLAEIKKQETEFKKKNKEAGVKTNNNGLTSAQENALNEARNVATKNHDKQIQDVYAEELAAMRDYLKSYGSLMQQREALEGDYNEKIKKAKTEGEKLSLQKEKETALANFKFDSISKGIDWKTLLGGVGNISTEMLKPMLEQLEAYTKTDDFAKADTDTQQKTVDLIDELKQYVGEQSTTWEQLSTAIQDFNDAVAEYDEAVKAEEQAKKQADQAKKDLDDGKISQDVYDEIVANLKAASEKAANAKTAMEEKGREVNDKTDDVKNYSSKLTQVLNKDGGTWKSVDGFSDIQGSVNNIDSLKGAFDAAAPAIGKGVGTEISSTIGGALSSIGGGMESILSSGIGQMVGFVAMIPKMILQLADTIKNFVTGILDSFSELLKFEWLSDLINSILDAIWNLIDTILDLPENIFHLLESIIVKGIGGLINNIIGRLGNILSFGALSSGGPASWFMNSNAKEVAEKTEKLTESNEKLQTSVDNLKDELSKQSGFKAINTAKQAKEDQEAINRQTMEILQTQMGYHGAHHSNAKNWNLKSDDYASINQTLANYKQKNPTADTTVNSVSSLSDIYKLTPEQIQYIQTYNIKMWDKMLDQGDYDKSEYWENYANLAGKLDKITDSLKKALTGTTFDNMKSNFVSNLMDMTKTAQDFSDDFSEMLMQSVLNAKISDMMDEELQTFYKKWAAYAESDNILDDSEINELKQEWQGYVQKGMQLRDQAAAITGYDGTSASQKTSSTGVSSMTQDQANELNGRFTALQIANELQNTYLMQSIGIQQGMFDILTTTQVDISDIKISASFISQNISEILDIQYESVDKLTKIATYTSVLPQMSENINNIYNSVKNL